MKNKSLKEFHRERIVDAADELFRIKGKAQTTVDEIAERANYSKATIYVYFKSKEEIFHYVFLRYMVMLKDRIKIGMSQDTDAIAQYYGICNELFLFSEEYPDYYRLLVSSVSIDIKSRQQSEILEEIYITGEEINDLIIEVISAGIVQGHFRMDIEILPMVFIYWASITSVIEMVNNKNEYIYDQMNLTKAEFLEYSFSNMLRIIIK